MTPGSVERRQRTPQRPRLHWAMLILCSGLGLASGLLLMGLGR